MQLPIRECVAAVGNFTFSAGEPETTTELTGSVLSSQSPELKSFIDQRDNLKVMGVPRGSAAVGSRVENGYGRTVFESDTKHRGRHSILTNPHPSRARLKGVPTSKSGGGQVIPGTVHQTGGKITDLRT